jgi:hypothetical protein
MELFESENEVREIIRSKILLIDDFVHDRIDDEQFWEGFDNFYYENCLDGHESDEEDRLILKKFEMQINLFEYIMHDIFMKICSDENSVLEIYIIHGRISRKAALIEMKEYINQNKEYFESLIDGLKI